ncbi:cytochrome P450 [Amycolatopsis pithecellobii]|uniref:Cytochrome P450 n=1 Tax=Amycolatopsis pithecellobii TaxID=664692 RepID=A0A6N7Z9L2_9PSEU|nr:cytochrome P450 [Amycolatopsis pithecellobii]MTD58419.1 cytochrome P450 [Amycolatopsis pithecellobii]
MTLTARVPHSDVDLFSDDVLLDPYPTYRVLRDQGPAVRLDALDAWALPRYDSARRALGDWETFSASGIALNETVAEMVIGTVLSTDPPAHTVLRSVLSERLGPRSVRPLQQEIAQRADALVDEVIRKGAFDAVTDLATAFPFSVVFDLIGLPDDARPNMLRSADATFTVLGPMNARTAESMGSVGEMFGWLGTLTAADLKDGSMGRAIFQAADEGRIRHESCVPLLAAYAAAGLDTTITSIANAVHLFATHPDQWDLVCAEPSLIPSALNEVLRYDAPVQVFGRKTTRGVELDSGVTIPADAQVLVLYGSGNRDERHYPEPDRFDATRNPTDHLSFGYGTHACAGQALARIEAQSIIGALAKRVHRFHIGTPTRHLNNTARGLETLPVTAVDLHTTRQTY